MFLRSSSPWLPCLFCRSWLLTSTPFYVTMWARAATGATVTAQPQLLGEDWPLPLLGGGHFFFIMSMIPKMTTANNVSSAIISLIVIVPPPAVLVFGGEPFRPCLAI